MKRWLILLALLSPSVARANTVTPAFTQGSMNATTNTTQTVTETVNQKVYGGELKSWSGTNVNPTGGTLDPSAAQTFTLEVDGADFQLELVERLADPVSGLVLLEDIDITRTINTTATTTSLSVFSQ